jgi:hypothetical protein
MYASRPRKGTPYLETLTTPQDPEISLTVKVEVEGEEDKTNKFTDPPTEYDPLKLAAGARSQTPVVVVNRAAVVARCGCCL